MNNDWDILQNLARSLVDNGNGTFSLRVTGAGASIGGAVASGTPGSVLFVDSSGNLGQDNTNFFFDDTANSLLVTGSVISPLLIGGTASGGSLVLQSTSHATKGTIDFGTALAGENVNIRATLSAELAAPLTDGNWTLGAGWQSPIVGTGLVKNADGTGLANMVSGIVGVIGTSYRIEITVSALTVGSFYFDFSGLTTVTISAPGTYVYYMVATATYGIFFHPANTSRFTISALSIKSLVDNTGDLTVDGNLQVRSPIKDAFGVVSLFLNNGSIFIPYGGAIANPTSALEIGNGGSIQLARTGTYNIKNTGGDILTAISMGVTNIMAFQNIGNTGEAYYGTNNAGSSNGNVAFQVRGSFGMFFTGSGAGKLIGIAGNTSPSAYFHIAAGTTAANTAPLKFTSGTVMTTPEVGAVEYNANNFHLTKNTALRETIPGVLFTQTADKTVSNTVTETSIIGTGVGTLTLPANFFVAGKTLRLRVGGIYSTPAISTPSVVIKVKLGSTVIATVTTSALLSGATNLEFDGEIAITCRSTGGSGTVMVHGDIEYATGVGGTISVDPLNNAGAVTIVDTTASKVLDITVTWDTATSTRSVTSIVTLLEVLN